MSGQTSVIAQSILATGPILVGRSIATLGQCAELTPDDVRAMLSVSTTADVSAAIAAAIVGHNHDDRYYTESEINTLLGSYLPLSGGTVSKIGMNRAVDPANGMLITSYWPSNTSQARFADTVDRTAHDLDIGPRSIWHTYAQGQRLVIGDAAHGVAGRDGIGFGGGSSSAVTIANSGVAIGCTSSNTLGFYTSNGTSQVQRAEINSNGLAVTGSVTGSGTYSFGSSSSTIIRDNAGNFEVCSFSTNPMASFRNTGLTLGVSCSPTVNATGIVSLGSLASSFWQNIYHRGELVNHNVGFPAGSAQERGYMRWISNVFTIGTEFAGAGVVRPIAIQPRGTVHSQVAFRAPTVSVTEVSITDQGGRELLLTSNGYSSTLTGKTYIANLNGGVALGGTSVEFATDGANALALTGSASGRTALFGGNVGIGIAPTAPLHISTSYAVTNYATMPFVNWVNTNNSSTQGHCNFRMDTTHADAVSGFVFANAGVIKWDWLTYGSPANLVIREAQNSYATAFHLLAGTGLGIGMAPTCRLDVSGPVRIGGYTFATVPSASASTGQTIRITDRQHRWATSDGTNWNWTGTTTPIS